VIGVLRDNGTEPGSRVEFQGRTPHLRWKELQDDLPGLQVVLRSEGFESFIDKTRVV
jgi:Xaa-Pro dipeptidase